jgi:hypothetical protein
LSEIDKRGRLEELPFSYRATKEGRVLLYWEGKLVKTLKAKAAEKFLKQIGSATESESQLIMAKLTGNFKHGNERTAKKKD